MLIIALFFAAAQQGQIWNTVMDELSDIRKFLIKLDEVRLIKLPKSFNKAGCGKYAGGS